MFRWLICLFILGQSVSKAQITNSPHDIADYVSEHYAQKDGLSQGSVYSIADYDGYIWFGTQDGLNRFDGYEFKIYKSDPGLSKSINNNWVQALLADKKGNFWVGTRGGLCLYNKDLEEFSRFNNAFDTNHSLDSVSIEKLIEDGYGNIWIMTDEHGLFRIDPGTLKIHNYLSENKQFYGFSIDRNGVLWVSAYDEIYFFDTKTGSMKQFQIKSILKNALSPKSIIQAIFIDSKNNIWVSTYQEGIFLLKGRRSDIVVSRFTKGKQKSDISSSEVTGFIEDASGRIWLATMGGGISVFDYSNNIFFQSLASNSVEMGSGQNHVLSLFQDKQGIVWAGLSYAGFDKYDPQKRIFGHISHDTDALNIGPAYSIYQKDNNLFIGCTDQLKSFSLITKSFDKRVQHFAKTNKLEVYGIASDSKNVLWIASHNHGLYKFDKKKGFVSYSNNRANEKAQYFLYSVEALKAIDEVWVGGHRGIERFDQKSKNWKTWDDIPEMKNVSSYSTRLLKEDSEGNVWLGTLGHGLLRYCQKTKQIIVFDKQSGLTCENIRSLFQDKGTMWVGTDCGLFRIDLNNLIVQNHYSVKTSGRFKLPNDVIYGILKDNNGYLWLSSNRGLAKFSPKDGILRTYDVTDGLQSNEFNTNVAYKHTDGTLYFGGVNGVNYFNPDHLKTNTFVPPIKITGIVVRDSIFAPNQKAIILHHTHNFINFEYVALNFSNPQKNQYKYKMEGIDDKWIDAGNKRTANYTNLPPGDYVFKVIGSNNDGVWNREGASVQITILSPWWSTWWFRALLILLLIGGVYGLFRYRLSQQLMRREAEIRASLMAQEVERQRFSRELHDGVGANLSLLKMYLSSFKDKDVPTKELKERSEKLLAGSIGEIRRLIHDMHPRSLQDLGLVKSVDEMVQLVNLVNEINIDFVAKDMPEYLYESMEINLFRIIQELLHNAIKHSEAKHVWLNMECSKHLLILTYKDDGKGFDTSKANEGNGLLNIRNRVTLLKGNITLNSAASQGTRLTIVIPT
jgi:signal transduction histidine kinase/ligand-binding sensor domain-containing protein